MRKDIIKKQAKKWAELFVKSEAEFVKDFKLTVDIGRFEPEELNAIIKLAQIYENYLTKLITQDEAIKRQKAILMEV